MNNTPDKTKTPVTTISKKSKEPSEVRITLSVCGCYSRKHVVFVAIKAEQVARILGITMQDLECVVVTAMLTNKPQVVACYKQRDVAENMLSQLRAEAPFVMQSCHSFKILNSD